MYFRHSKLFRSKNQCQQLQGKLQLIFSLFSYYFLSDTVCRKPTLKSICSIDSSILCAISFLSQPSCSCKTAKFTRETVASFFDNFCMLLGVTNINISIFNEEIKMCGHKCRVPTFSSQKCRDFSIFGHF